MHMIIGAIVYAEDEEVALEKGKTIFKNLVEKEYFDYYTTMDEEFINNFPPVMRADSKDGKRFIRDNWRATKREFMKAYEKCKWILDHLTPEQIMEDKIPESLREEASKVSVLGLVRYWFYELGAYKGPRIWLYDDNEEGIREKWHLKEVLRKWNRPGYGNLNVYVVPADVHY